MNALVGYTGFVGSNLLQFYKFDYFYNSKNFNEAKNKKFDTLFFCGMPAVKWYANKNPEEDFNTLKNIQSILNTIEVNKIILISTIDVYDDVYTKLDEDYNIQYNKNHIYGKNRFLFEEFIKNKFNDYNIIRLPALFGKGLKKNIIYDLIHNNNVNDIPLNSSFQWYYLEWLKKDIDIILKNNIKVCNLFTEPIHTKEIIKVFHEVFKIDYHFQLEYLGDEKPMKKYDLCTKYNNYFNNEQKYIIGQSEIINAIKEYLLYEKLDKTKLCVSNICVNQIHQLQFASILKLFGIKNIQIAPTKLIQTWDNLENLDLNIYRNLDLNIYAFQSITFTLNELNIFNKATIEKLYNHLIKIINVAEKNNVSVLVFGCPRNRKFLDEKLDNNKTFIDFFKRIGDYLNDKNVKICLENNSKIYNCNFINTIQECSYLVREINKDNIKMMVDLGNAVMEKDEWYYLKKDMDIIYNIDVAHENMRDFSEVHESNEIFNFVLKKNNYDKIINLEMLIKDGNNELDILIKSLNNFIDIYTVKN
tara:strand:+ start:3580 stop:5172 length:1593 start_codon:yes stop_codon:yes gene_type:complete